MAPTVHDVTTFPSPNGTSPYIDIRTVINEIVADIRTAQTTQLTRPGLAPAGCIRCLPGQPGLSPPPN